MPVVVDAAAVCAWLAAGTITITISGIVRANTFSSWQY
jgi:hypothetical protein